MAMTNRNRIVRLLWLGNLALDRYPDPHPVIHQALPNQWFEKQGLFSLLKSYDQLSV